MRVWRPLCKRLHIEGVPGKDRPKAQQSSPRPLDPALIELGPTPARRMVTIKDVAREANASAATVSRVLNGSGPASDATPRLSRDVAARMRYVPHSGARSRITRKTQTPGVPPP